jgi:cysteine synthase
MQVAKNILDSIGNTSLVQLNRTVPEGSAKIFAKLEWQNPTGSMKDRMALGLISKAESEGKIGPGYTIVEYTGGSTGASLALVCTAKGYRIEVVTSKAFSQEKIDQMAAYGAKINLVPYHGGGITRELIWSMIHAAEKLSLEPRTYWANQIDNPDTVFGYYPLGEEIWRQTKGQVDAFVHSVGSAASLNGVATVLKRHNPKVKIFAVEPEESCVLSGGKSGGHDIEGIAIGRFPTHWNPGLVDGILTVKTEEAKEMARRLAREEGLFAGTSSGGNVHAALRVARELGPKANVVTLMVDSGLKYLSTDLYRGCAGV